VEKQKESEFLDRRSYHIQILSCGQSRITDLTFLSLGGADAHDFSTALGTVGQRTGNSLFIIGMGKDC
jgi:hypothetical protein